jgi:hypothetical protein|tara:strand:+ start:324 stop:440 length:117 start_codon:yes stop_codon:yes gene_type:complete
VIELDTSEGSHDGTSPDFPERDNSIKKMKQDDEQIELR